MKKFALTTRLNIQIVAVVSLFMIVFTVYSQWLSLQETKNEYGRQLDVITTYLAGKMPAASFVQIATRQGAAEKPVSEQVMAVNKELQLILDDMPVTTTAVKFGYYSLFHQRIVAIGPDFDKSLLLTADSRLFETMHGTGESSDSPVWQGAPIIYHLKPVKVDGEIIGYVFACANLNSVHAEFEKRTLHTLLGGFFALLALIALFQDIFVKLKKTLERYAEEIIKGRAKHFESEIPELTPIFKYISEQTENLVRLDRLNIIGEMAASLGHEVRNPMTTVRGFLQYMQGKEKFSDCKTHFALMIQELDRANDIIAEFLSLAKNKAMSFRPLNLNKVVTEVFPLLQVDALRHNCSIDISLGIIPDVELDQSSIRQLILNLVRNAIEAMPQGGAINISTASRAEQVLMSITDEGTGIPPEIMDKLGTPFVTTKETGIGLGLAVCYRIVQRHGATINVTSSPTGTTFRIGFNRAGLKPETGGGPQRPSLGLPAG